MPTSAAPRAPFVSRFVHPLVLLVLMWAIELADRILPGRFETLGVRAWDPTHLAGILFAPLLHTTWGHLIANSAPFLILGCLVALEGARRFWAVTAITTVVGGVGPWFLALPGTVTVGASGLVFGYFAYLLARSLTARGAAHRILHGVVAVTVFVLYGGSMLAGVLPIQAGVSWQGHLFGAVGGVLAAILVRPRTRAAGAGPAGL